jgi:hypothetical protein
LEQTEEKTIEEDLEEHKVNYRKFFYATIIIFVAFLLVFAFLLNRVGALENKTKDLQTLKLIVCADDKTCTERFVYVSGEVGKTYSTSGEDKNVGDQNNSTSTGY